jgi:hypothetical protein
VGGSGVAGTRPTRRQQQIACTEYAPRTTTASDESPRHIGITGVGAEEGDDRWPGADAGPTVSINPVRA